MRKREINIGDVFGDWTIIDLNCESRNKARYVKCRCKCGVEKEVILSGLLHNKTTCCKSWHRKTNCMAWKSTQSHSNGCHEKVTNLPFHQRKRRYIYRSIGSHQQSPARTLLQCLWHGSRY